ncbi:hypothetical protein Tco_1148963 [Tanacetum coccineum]
MPPRKNRTLNEVHEQELEDRVMARMEERFDQFVDQLSDRMDQLMNRRGRVSTLDSMTTGSDTNSEGSVLMLDSQVSHSLDWDSDSLG